MCHPATAHNASPITHNPSVSLRLCVSPSLCLCVKTPSAFLCQTLLFSVVKPPLSLCFYKI